MLISVFDQAAPVLEGKATFSACERGELVLVRVEVAVEIKRLAAVERHPAILAQQATFFGFRSQVLLRASCLLHNSIHNTCPPLGRFHARASLFFFSWKREERTTIGTLKVNVHLENKQYTSPNPKSLKHPMSIQNECSL